MELDLSQKQLESVEKIAKERGFQNYDVEVNKGSIKGDNYLGVIKIVNIKEKNDEKQLNLILKASLVGEVRKNTPIENAYQREILMYDEIFFKLRQFQDEYFVENGFNNVAKLYGFCKEINDEFLILENLRENGFQLFDRKKQMGPEHVELVLKTYGKFHALSYALKELKPELFQELKGKLFPVFEKMEEEKARMYIERMTAVAFKAVGDNEKAVSGLKRFFSGIEKLLLASIFGENENSVIKHGDCWCNNLMFKYQDSSNIPSDIRLLDWQLAGIGSPILDISYFFYSCSSDEVIQNYKKYLESYYDSVVQTLKQFGVDPEKAFPRNIFDEEWKNFAQFGLYMALFLINLCLAESSEAPDLTEAAEAGSSMIDIMTKEFGNQKEFNRRITNIVLHMVDNNLI